MKCIPKKLYVFLCLLLSLFELKAVNDSLIISQAFDWRVGDTLIYRPYGYCYQTGTSYAKHLGFTVVNRSVISDSLIYSVQYFAGNYDTLVFSHKDSLLTSFTRPLGFVYGMCNQSDTLPTGGYNLQQNYTTNSFYPFKDGYHHQESWLDFGIQLELSKRVGIVFLQASYAELYGQCGLSPTFPNSGGCGSRLVYYSSDSVRWMDEEIYFATDINDETIATNQCNIYPNPSGNEISVAFYGAVSGPLDISLIDIKGNMLLSTNGFTGHILSFNIASLAQGCYTIKITDRNNSTLYKKLIISR